MRQQSIRSHAPPEVEPQTRDRILDTAERLFAEHGFQAASVRDITAKAGVNVAAINYHFGGKEPLYREVIVRRLRALREQRIESIRRAGEDRADLEGLLRAFVTAFLDPVSDWERGRVLVQLMSREMMDKVLPADLCSSVLMAPVERALSDALRHRTPGLDETSARLSVHSLVGQLMHVVHMGRFHGTLDVKQSVGLSFAALTDHIVRFSAAGIRGCAEGTLS